MEDALAEFFLLPDYVSLIGLLNNAIEADGAYVDSVMSEWKVPGQALNRPGFRS